MAAVAQDLGIELEDDDIQTQQVLLAASHHDIETLRTLLKTIPATVQDPETGYTPLHAAIAACVPDDDDDTRANGDVHVNGNGDSIRDNEQAETLQAAEKTMRLLLQNGAIWSDLDVNDETPGCLARRLKLSSLYEIMVDAGVRAELLMNRLDDFAPLGGEDEDDDEEIATETDEMEMVEVIDVNEETNGTIQDIHNGTAGDESTESAHYLDSDLTFTDDRLVDSSNNGVMMQWESNIMKRSADVLLPSEGLSVLNIGHGMGIIDALFQDKKPAVHHIIEAHPQVLSQMLSTGWRSSDEPTSTTSSNSTHPNVTVHAGKWQDILPSLLTSGVTFDAIYFDTFAEDYKAFRHFFEEYVIGLLKPEGRWSFFHGLGADRQVCYDVYTKVVEMDLFEVGFDVEWEEFETTEADREGEWQGVRRRYWALDKYRLPMCSFVG